MVTIRQPMLDDCFALAVMLNTDTLLRDDLGIGSDYQTETYSILLHIRQWCCSRRGISYIIDADKTVVGLISLCRIDHAARTGQVGYWIGSQYRRQGYCTEAFRQIIKLAASLNLCCISADIDSDNIPSRRLWEQAEGIGAPLSKTCCRYQLTV